MTAQYQEKIIRNCERILEDVTYSYKGHYNAGAFWSNINLTLGLFAILLGIVASSFVFKDSGDLNNAITFSATVLSSAVVAVLTFLQPQKIAQTHNKSGSDYHRLRNDIMNFKEVTIYSGMEDKQLEQEYQRLIYQLNLVNDLSLEIPRKAYLKAKKDIEKGAAHHQVDKEKSRERQ